MIEKIKTKRELAGTTKLAAHQMDHKRGKKKA
jgi:hypothetical protein